VSGLEKDAITAANAKGESEIFLRSVSEPDWLETARKEFLCSDASHLELRTQY
jgi:hypothetical protein